MGMTERVELRLDEDLLRLVDDWMQRTRRASTRSDALRQLIELGLETATGNAIQLSDGEKLNLLVLRDLVKHLKVPTDVDLDFMAQVIRGGHYWAPAMQMHGLFHNHADQPANVSFVADVLDMWTAIELRVDTLAGADLATVKAANHGQAPRFSGFDGNHETELMGIARFFVDQMDRFTRFKGRDLNAHMPTAARARRMLRAFGPIRDKMAFGRDLSAAEIVEILEAGRA